jgi:hypothetical protein
MMRAKHNASGDMDGHKWRCWVRVGGWCEWVGGWVGWESVC